MTSNKKTKKIWSDQTDMQKKKQLSAQNEFKLITALLAAYQLARIKRNVLGFFTFRDRYV